MKIERFVGRDSRDAMAKVRADLGADAYILANRRVGGRVEVTAALDIDEAIESAALHKGAGASPTNEIQLKALERELQHLRGILESELGERSWRDVAGRNPGLSTAKQRLLRLGLSRTLASALLDRVPSTATLEQAWRLALGNLAGMISTSATSVTESSVTAVYGGTGVGKTSTLAKLAARDVRRLGADRVGLITLDNYRIGAQEQLASFADALGVALRPASDAHELSVALREFRGRQIYIDTAGMNQHDPRLQEQYELIAGLRQPVAHLLVLAASAQASQSRAIASAFGRGAFSGAIITKVDEAQSIGGVLDVIIGSKLPLHSVADGQRVPEDIRDANAQELVRKAVKLGSSGRAGASAAHSVRGLRISA